MALRSVRSAYDRGSQATFVGHRMGDQKFINSSSSVLGWSTNSHWARVVAYGPFSLCVIHKDGLWPSSGDINRLMMMNFYFLRLVWCPG
jgi:hypothetical protein